MMGATVSACIIFSVLAAAFAFVGGYMLSGRLSSRYWNGVLEAKRRADRHCPPHWVRDGEIDALRGVARAARAALAEVDAINSETKAYVLTKSIGPPLHNAVMKLAKIDGEEVDRGNVMP